MLEGAIFITKISITVKVLFRIGAGPGLVGTLTTSSIFPFRLSGQAIAVGLPIGGDLLTANGINLGFTLEAASPVAVGYSIVPRYVDDGTSATAPALIVWFIAIGIVAKGVVFVEGDFVATEVKTAEG